jgi:hypothetical protein
MKSRRPAGMIVGGLLGLFIAAAAGRALAVDGVIEINQAKANAGGVTPGDAPGLPITISTGTFASDPMSFRLTGPIITSTTGNVIEILSPHVTLDLNGFSINCLLPACAGIGVQTTQDNVTVSNGTVRNFATGVQATGIDANVENVRALNNSGTGIDVGNNCRVSNCTATGNGVEGIKGGTGCRVSGNVANSNTSDGIVAGQGSNVSSNTARSNTGVGLNLSANTGYSGNVISANTGGTVISGVSAGQNLCNGSLTCP